MPEAECGGVRIHYERSGMEGGEVLVLGNSLGSSLRMWDKVLPWFESKYCVIRFDTRGHGRSSVPDGPYTIEDLGRDVLCLLDWLCFPRVNFCGLSMGGLVAMWLGIHAPERVKQLVMANTGARIGSQGIWDERIALAQEAGMAAVAEMMPARWFTSAYRQEHAEEMARIRQMVSATAPLGYVSCCGVLRNTDLRGEVVAISAPCLVIAGSQDPATPPSDAKAIHEAMRNSRYIELEASHLSAWERAEDFGTGVVRFLGNGEAGNG